MDAPKCKLCGERHYGVCKPVAEAYGTSPVMAALPKLQADEKKRGNKLKIAFDRAAYQKAYMRDYMRKRRAAKKGKPHDGD